MGFGLRPPPETGLPGPDGAVFEPVKKLVLPSPEDFQSFNKFQENIITEKKISPGTNLPQKEEFESSKLKYGSCNLKFEGSSLEERKESFSQFERKIEEKMHSRIEQDYKSQEISSFENFEVQKKENNEETQNLKRFSNLGRDTKQKENPISFDNFASTTFSDFNTVQQASSHFENFSTSADAKFEGFGQWDNANTSNLTTGKQNDFIEFNSFQQTNNAPKDPEDFGDFSSFAGGKISSNQNENFSNFDTFDSKPKVEETKEFHSTNSKETDEFHHKSLEPREQPTNDQNQFDMIYSGEGNVESQEFSFVHNQNDLTFSSSQEAGSQNRLSHSRTIDLKKIDNIQAILDDLRTSEVFDVNEIIKTQEALDKILKYFYRVNFYKSSY